MNPRSTPAMAPVSPTQAATGQWLMSVMLLMMVAVFCWLHASYWLPNHDVSVILVEAQKIFAGGRFHEDVVETNPPLIIFLSLPGVWLSSVFGWSALNSLMGWFGLVIACSAIATNRIWAMALSDVSPWARLTVIVWALLVIPGYDFGQREHLAVCLVLPAFSMFAASEIGIDRRVNWSAYSAAFLMAAIGMLLKPFFLAVFGVCILARCVWRADWRPLFGIETRIVAVTSIIYVAAIWLFAHGWFDTLALVVQVYFGYNTSRSVLWRVYSPYTVWVCLAGLLLVLPGFLAKRRFFVVVWLAAFTWLLMAFLQMKGWRYHVLPTLMMLFIFFGLASAQLWAAKRWLAMVPCLVLAVYVGKDNLHDYRNPGNLQATQIATPFAKAVVRYGHGRPWMAITDAVTPAFPLVTMLNTEWASRQVCQWLLPGTEKLAAKPGVDPAIVSRLRQTAARMNAEDLERYRPALVMVERKRSLFMPEPVDYVDMFSAFPAFRQAWLHYRFVEEVDGWAVYVRN